MQLLSGEPFIAITDRFADEWYYPPFDEITLHSSYLQAYNHLTLNQFQRESYSGYDFERRYWKLQHQIYEAIKQEFYFNDPLPYYEVVELTEYQAGGCFREHYDFSPYLEYPRVATAILYCNDGFEGGDTFFKNLNIRVKPKRGRLLYFRYDNPMSCDWTGHEGTPVLQGTKRIVSQWIGTVPLPF